MLEDELRSKLQYAWAVSDPGLKEVGRAEATGGGGEPSAACGAALVTSQRAPLSVIEDVECFYPELEGGPLLDGEVLEQRHVDIPVARITQEIPSGIAERQTNRRSKGVAPYRPSEHGADQERISGNVQVAYKSPSELGE